MSHLTVYKDDNAALHLWQSNDHAAIAEKLKSAGIRFEKWNTQVDLSLQADDASIIAAYADEIERIKKDGGYQSIDIIRVLADNPKRVELRNKFLSEHTHTEDEVRFFVDGSGMFYLHVEGHVYMVLCERGDLISVPDGVKHWFDLGDKPHLAAIRFFTNIEGWVANYTENKIADHFPKLGQQEAA
ncbi:MAG: hypothetical protein WCD70_00130 [Alphaproteobacteria bacterium]